MVALEKSGVFFEVSTDDFLMDGLLTQKAPVIAACRAGVCGACKVQILDGEVESTTNAVLTPAELEQGYVLSCCSRPKSNLRINI